MARLVALAAGSVAIAPGVGSGRVMFRHILSHILAPLMAQGSVALGLAILTEAARSYVGLGTQPPDPSWGTMLNEGRICLEIVPCSGSIFWATICGICVMQYCAGVTSIVCFA